jgi:hypothetical protein
LTLPTTPQDRRGNAVNTRDHLFARRLLREPASRLKQLSFQRHRRAPLAPQARRADAVVSSTYCSKEQIVLLKPLVIACCVGLLAGCATPQFDQPPSLTEVSVRVAWSTNDQINVRCGSDKLACATVGRAETPFSQIWTEKPSNNRDSRKVCALGHEFLHSLGANHNH